MNDGQEELELAGAELVRPPSRPPAQSDVGQVLIHIQLPRDVDVDVFAGKVKAGVMRLEPRAYVHTVRQPAR